MKTVLVVEDSELSRGFICMALSSRPDIKIIEASDGQEAWEILEGNCVSLVITDLHMPRLDGFGLLKKIREAEPVDAHVPVIAVTTQGQLETMDALVDEGADACIAKPVTPQALLPLLDRYLSTQTEPLQSIAPSNPDPGVEPVSGLDPDEASGLVVMAAGAARDEIVRELAATLGAEPLVAETGMEAVGQLFLHTINYLLVDMSLPGNEAVVFLGQLRGNQAYNSLPVALLVTKAVEQDLAELDNLGADQIIPESVGPGKVAELIGQFPLRPAD